MRDMFLQIISMVVGTSILSLFGLIGNQKPLIGVSKSQPKKWRVVTISGIFVAVVLLALLAIISPK